MLIITLSKLCLKPSLNICLINLTCVNFEKNDFVFIHLQFRFVFCFSGERILGMAKTVSNCSFIDPIFNVLKSFRQDRLSDVNKVKKAFVLIGQGDL